MVRKKTIRVRHVDIVVTVEDLAEAVWLASTRFRGEPYAAKAATPDVAMMALLTAIESELRSECDG